MEFNTLFAEYGTEGFILTYYQYIVLSKYFNQYKNIVSGDWSLYLWPKNNFISDNISSSDLEIKCPFMSEEVEYFCMYISPAFIKNWVDSFYIINNNSNKPLYFIYNFDKLIAYWSPDTTLHFRMKCSEGRYWYRIHASEYECYHFLDNNDVYSPYSDHELSEFLSVNSINANNANNTRDYNVNMNINDSRLISFSDRTITTQSVENRYLRNTNNNTNKLPELSTYIKDLIKNSIKAGDECIVCTEILSEMDKSNISVRNCGHIFCTSCYDKTLNKCPICNKS